MSTETIWAVAGILLIIADVIFGSFYMLFLGGAALLTALCIWLRILPNEASQWIFFAGVSALSILFFRKKLVALFGKDSANQYEEHSGQKVTVVTPIADHGTGRVSYRGTEWTAKTVDGSALESGTIAVIRETDGIILKVEKES